MSSSNCSQSLDGASLPGTTTLNNITDSSLPDYSVFEPTAPPPDYLDLMEDRFTCDLGPELQEQQFTQRKSIALPPPPTVNIQSCHDLISFLYSLFHMLETIPQALQRVYMCRAELRYIRWLQILYRERPSYDSILETILPPLDVMLCWYAHMLSPYRYRDDLIRNSWEYLFRYPLPLAKARNVKTKYKSGKDPISERFWTALLPDEPYELTVAELQSDERSFTCVFCKQSQQSTWSEYSRMHSDPSFYIMCTHCKSKSSTQTLSCYQFVRDMVESDETHIFFKGAMLDSDGQKAKSNMAKGIKVRLLAKMMKEHDTSAVLTPSILKSSDECDWAKVMQQLLSNLVKKRMPTLRNLTWGVLTDMVKASYFGIVTPLCIDLVQAVGRQHAFIQTLVATDWQKVASLNFAIRRYGMFLGLLKQRHILSTSSTTLSNPPPMVPAVPTVDIDLCWNVHMVASPQDYAQYCTDTFDGYVINHDDMIPSENVAGSAVLMAITWYREYDEPYTTASLVAEHESRATLLGWMKRKTTQGTSRWKKWKNKQDGGSVAQIDSKVDINTHGSTIARQPTSQVLSSSQNTSSSSGMDTIYLHRPSSLSSSSSAAATSILSELSAQLSTSPFSSSPHQTPPRSIKEKYNLFLETMTDIALHNQDAVNAWYGLHPGATSTAICDVDKIDPQELFFGNYGYIGSTSSPIHVMATKYGSRLEHI